eukprot:COSAG02_NODE_706_length_18259_cov_10.340253_4_plen_79_part_00
MIAVTHAAPAPPAPTLARAAGDRATGPVGVILFTIVELEVRHLDTSQCFPWEAGSDFCGRGLCGREGGSSSQLPPSTL